MGKVDLSKYDVRVELSRGQPDARFFLVRPRKERGDYFSAVWTFVKVVFSFDPRPATTVMIATAMPAAIKPYSIAVAADSSRQNWTKWCFMTNAPCYPIISQPFALSRRENRS
jgi:hypothetical protein